MAKRAGKAASEPIVIGWKERVELPDWNVRWILAKADTGARTGAIDVSNLIELPDNRVRFDVVVHRAGDEHVVCRSIEADVTRRSRVKSSFGSSQERLFVETTLRLGPVKKRVELGLVCRKNLLCRMLLGRAALQPEFVVDASRRYVFGTHRTRRVSRSVSAKNEEA